jgi:hypothetical protein
MLYSPSATAAAAAAVTAAVTNRAPSSPPFRPPVHLCSTSFYFYIHRFQESAWRSPRETSLQLQAGFET